MSAWSNSRLLRISTSAGAVVNWLGALVEEGAVIFVGFAADEERAVARRARTSSTGNAANHEPRFIAAGFKDRGCHAGGGFAVGPATANTSDRAARSRYACWEPGHMDVIFQHRQRTGCRECSVTDDHPSPGQAPAGWVIALNSSTVSSRVLIGSEDRRWHPAPLPHDQQGARRHNTAPINTCHRFLNMNAHSSFLFFIRGTFYPYRAGEMHFRRICILLARFTCAHFFDSLLVVCVRFTQHKNAR